MTSDARGGPDIWDELTAGTLRPELRAALKLLAEQHEQLGTRYVAHAPLDAAFRARVSEAIERQRIREARRRRLRRLSASGFFGSLAAAALLSLFSGREVPPYDLTVSGGVAERRGASGRAEELVATPVSELELVLRPAYRVEGDLSLTVYLLTDGAALPLRVAPQRDQSGAFRLRGTMGELFAAPYGSYLLVAAVERSALSARELSQRLSTRDGRVEALRLTFRPD